MKEALEKVLDKFRPGFQADGADVVIAGIDPSGLVDVHLLIDDKTCMECLLPDDMLGQMLAQAMRSSVADVTKVNVTRVTR
jgi:Fe-S cluster biogenesis protein NfuA